MGHLVVIDRAGGARSMTNPNTVMHSHVQGMNV
jgi:hypothetical protein